jgi:ferrochelatase
MPASPALRSHALTHATRASVHQAAALRAALAGKGTDAKVYVAMRYWRPFTEEAVAQIKRDRITRLVVLPLYPQFSISTSGSSLRLLEALFREDEYLSRMKHTVIPSWYQRRGYVVAMADLIQTELTAAFPPAVPVELGGSGSANIFFSAHGVPLSYVNDAGDPYKEEIEECVSLIMAELRARGVPNPHTLAYQSRVGPVEWLKPYTDATIRELGEQGTPALLAVPISFVSEHIETLEEIDCEYRELAEEVGIKGWGRVPALGVDPTFIGDLADAVLEALPHTGAMPSMAPPPPSAGGDAALVPLGSVEDLLATYDGERLRLPPPIVVWRWGFTRSAEVWNGRLAMLAILSLLALEAGTGQGVLHTVGLL